MNAKRLILVVTTLVVPALFVAAVYLLAHVLFGFLGEQRDLTAWAIVAYFVMLVTAVQIIRPYWDQ